MTLARPSGFEPAARLRRLSAQCAIAAIHAYRLAVSPLLAPACRFEPSCSAYATEAIARHGLRAGARLALRRLGRCHPFRPGGYDPVPGEAPRGT
jgi:putative membrane protein insertion efficiency factor